MPAAKAYPVVFIEASSPISPVKPKIDVKRETRKEIFDNALVVKIIVLKSMFSICRETMIRLARVQQPLMNKRTRPEIINQVEIFLLIQISPNTNDNEKFLFKISTTNIVDQ